MKNTKKLIAIAFALSAAISSPAYAEKEPATKNPLNLSATEEVSPVVYEDTSGVTMELDASGNTWIKMRSTGEAELRFGDRKDVIQAKRKATLAAKAELVKFMSERLGSSEVVGEITKTISETTNTANADTRKSVETLTTEMHSASEAILKGILTLEQKVDTVNKVVTVTVGVSRKTMGVADAISGNMNSNMSGQVSGGANNGSNSNSSANVKSEVRRSKNYDNF